jgi:AcrR family transcriptional regulator
MNPPVESSSRDPIKQRVLGAARLLFSERGLRGTDFREICQRAGTDVATVCCLFRCKEELYEAVVSDASFQLATAAERLSKFSDDVPSETRLRRIITALFKKLGEDRAWIARLVARQMADPAGERAGWVGLGLEKYFLLLQAEINKMQGLLADREVVRLHALSVISQCLFYCLAGENLPQVFLRLEGPLPAREMMVRHIASLSLSDLARQKGGFRKT